MDASTLRDAADTLTEKVSDLAHTVAELTPEVTDKIGDTALKLAALTPWVEPPSSSSFRPALWFRRHWMFAVAGLAALGMAGWWWTNRRTRSAELDKEFDAAATTPSDRRLRAAAGS
jgi:hypothetical protein